MTGPTRISSSEGSGPSGSRTASAARYPPKLCDAILDNITVSRSTPQDGGRKLPSAHVFLDPPGFEHWSRADQVAHRIQDLRAVAQQLGHQDLFDRLAATGREQGGSTGFPSNRAMAVRAPMASSEETSERPEAPKAGETSSGVKIASETLYLAKLTNALNRINDTLGLFLTDGRSGRVGSPTPGHGCPGPGTGEPTEAEFATLRAAPALAPETPQAGPGGRRGGP